MAEWEVNKGVGRGLEFYGLTLRYLIILVFGLVGLSFFVGILSLVGINHFVCVIVALLGACLLVWQTFGLNKKYGEHGLMKRQAKSSQPFFLEHTRLVRTMIKISKHHSHENQRKG